MPSRPPLGPETSILVVGLPTSERVAIERLVRAGGHQVEAVDELAARPRPGPTAASWPDLAIVVPVARADGVAACAALRASSPHPILVVAPGPDEEFVVAVLDAGADDVMVPPVAPREFVARMAAALRFRQALAEVATPEVVAVGGVHLDLTDHTATIGSRSIELPVNELRLLRALAARAGATVPADELAAELWPDEPGPHRNRLRVTVARLRRLLSGVPSPPVITLERGVGYALADAPAPPSGT